MPNRENLALKWTTQLGAQNRYNSFFVGSLHLQQRECHLRPCALPAAKWLDGQLGRFLCRETAWAHAASHW